MAREKNLSTNSFCILIQSNFIPYRILKKESFVFFNFCFPTYFESYTCSYINISRQINNFKKKKMYKTGSIIIRNEEHYNI